MHDIWGSHGREDVDLLGYNAMWTQIDTNVSEVHITSTFNPEDGGSIFLWNIGIYLKVRMALQPRRP
jgi:hypothetical protein